MENFIKQIIKNLESNGFPDKTVTLPTEKMYEVADGKDLSLNTVLDEMKKSNDMNIEITDEKIIFSTKNNISNESFANMDQNEMFKQAQEMLSKMDPAEVEKMQEMFTNMSEEEKEELMQKGKDLGLA